MIGDSWGFALQYPWGCSTWGFTPGEFSGAIQLGGPWLYSKLREDVTTKLQLEGRLENAKSFVYL